MWMASVGTLSRKTHTLRHPLPLPPPPPPPPPPTSHLFKGAVRASHVNVVWHVCRAVNSRAKYLDLRAPISVHMDHYEHHTNAACAGRLWS